MAQSVVLCCSSGEDLSCENMQGGDILVIPWENKKLKSKVLTLCSILVHLKQSSKD